MYKNLENCIETIKTFITPNDSFEVESTLSFNKWDFVNQKDYQKLCHYLYISNIPYIEFFGEIRLDKSDIEATIKRSNILENNTWSYELILLPNNGTSNRVTKSICVIKFGDSIEENISLLTDIVKNSEIIMNKEFNIKELVANYKTSNDIDDHLVLLKKKLYIL